MLAWSYRYDGSPILSDFLPRPYRKVYVDKVKTEYRDVVRIDSVYNRDTVAIRLSGDTVYKDVIKWRERWQLRIDSFTRVDSVPYAVEVVREVNRLTAWQKKQIAGFWIAVGLIGIGIALKLKRTLRSV